MMAARELRPLAGVVYCGNLAIVGASWIPTFLPRRRPLPSNFADQWTELLPWAAIAIAFIACAIGEMRRYEKPGRVMVDLACSSLALIYVGVFISILWRLRFLGGAEFGLSGLLTLIIVVKMGDIGAYAVGRLIGRHKMAPILSPGKTWEGAVGAVAFATLGAWLSFKCVVPTLLPKADGVAFVADPWVCNSYGVAIGVTGLIGDLAESLLKRDAGVKDSSRWMPGFGGVLDILDSILLSAPVAYLYWSFLLLVYF